MTRFDKTDTAGSLLHALLVVVALGTFWTSMAQATGVDPKAAKILDRMTTYLSKVQQLSVDTQNTLEAVLTSGSKILFDSAASVTLERPNKLRAERYDGLPSQSLYYDGRTLTLYHPVDKYYATVSAPETLEGMLDFARESLDLVAPAADLLYANSYDRLMQDVRTGFVVGKAVVGGVSCDHLAFSGPDVDWQIWIADGDKPLPRRYVVTTRHMVGQPQYMVLMNNWNTQANLADAEFNFVPPPDAKEIDFILPAATGTLR
ncbi:MAG: DUF2092 domain-containing protein [Sedimenticolaceae bacterium]